MYLFIQGGTPFERPPTKGMASQEGLHYIYTERQKKLYKS